jgi:hypothetical protein
MKHYGPRRYWVPRRQLNSSISWDVMLHSPVKVDVLEERQWTFFGLNSVKSHKIELFTTVRT